MGRPSLLDNGLEKFLEKTFFSTAVLVRVETSVADLRTYGGFAKVKRENCRYSSGLEKE